MSDQCRAEFEKLAKEREVIVFRCNRCNHRTKGRHPGKCKKCGCPEHRMIGGEQKRLFQ